MALGDHTPQTAADELADAIGDLHPSAKGKTHNAVSIPGGGALVAVDLATAGYERLVLFCKLTAGAATDLNFALRPYLDDETLFDTGIEGTSINVEAAGTTVLVSGIAYGWKTYFLRGLTKVSVRVWNFNAGAQTATCSYFLAK